MSRNRQFFEDTIPLVRIPLSSPVMGLAEDRESGDQIVLHRHDCAQLIHASRGVMTVNTEDGLWVVPPERAVWVPAFTTHSIRMTGRVELRTLYLDPGITLLEKCFVVGVTDLLHAGIMRVIEFQQPYAEGGAEARVVELILDEIREAPIAPLHLPTPKDVHARQISDTFQANPADRRPRREWAQLVGMSERTLERLFQNEVGTTFGRWQQQARLLRALEILATGESVTNAALEVGFETPSAFIAMFRRSLGTTPARYFRTLASPDRTLVE
jgi:AraC-like DNA-binding protein